MGIKLESPWKFRERMLFTGGGGAGKTEAVLSIARRLSKGKMWVIDNDFSYAYERALETTYTDVRDEGRVEVIEVGDGWEPLVEATARVMREGDHNDDWLVVDSASPTWDAVQGWYAQQVMGGSLAEYMVELRKNSADMKEFNKALAADGRWQFINKEYFDKFYGVIRNWRGHLILTAEAAAIGRDESDEIKEVFGHLGYKPKGQGRLHHIGHTNLFFVKRGHDRWTVTTVKDRNRQEVERMDVKDFAMDYLRGIAGWKVVVEAKPVQQEGEGAADTAD
jgi:hypothetical protein